MANINKIRLSGTTYNIEDENAAKSVTLTQAEYDALVSGGTVDPNTFYIISDSSIVYMTSADTESAITQAVSGKQDTLVSGTNIKTINNESILGSGNIDIQGGGKAIEGGHGITVTTGATADTVSINLPISAGTGTNSILEGSNNQASDVCSHAEGYNTKASGSYSHAEGVGTEAKNDYEHASGRYNVSRTGNTDADRTLFTVGNGTGLGENASNAFEIRQNDDIYIVKDNQYKKLQDYIGIDASSAITSGDTNAVAGGAVYSKFDEVEQVTAAGLNALNESLNGKADTTAFTAHTADTTIHVTTAQTAAWDAKQNALTIDSTVTSGSTNPVQGGAVYTQLGGLKLQKLTQAQYDALATKDSNTLYVLVN